MKYRNEYERKNIRGEKTSKETEKREDGMTYKYKTPSSPQIHEPDV